MKRAIGFYTETLGLKLKANYGDQFAQVEAPGVIIALHPTSSRGPRPSASGNLSIGFDVDNLEKTMNELKSKGVRFSDVRDDAQVRLAFFEDADGNPLYLSQSKWG
jgi:catechol 2,3-dioxygenase-like lactoylglutathione lyase family enzyme